MLATLSLCLSLGGCWLVVGAAAGGGAGYILGQKSAQKQPATAPSATTPSTAATTDQANQATEP